MKKRNLLLIPVVICILICAASIGYIQFHPEQAPAGTEFLARTDGTAQPTASGSGSGSGATDTAAETKTDTQELTASQKRAQELTADMTLEQKLYQMLFVTPEALTDSQRAVVRAGDTTKKSLATTPVGGVLYAKQNLQTTAQVTSMLKNTQDYAKQSGANIPVFTGIQETAGINDAAAVLKTTKYDNASVYGSKNDTDGVYQMGKTLASDLTKLGFNVDLAPIANLTENTLDIDRFSSDAKITASLSAAQVKGLQEGGMLSAVSRFPGLNSDTADEQLTVFQSCIKQDAAFVIVTNAVVDAYGTKPCSTSEQVMTEILREEMDYTGIVMTDALSELKSPYQETEVAVQAVQAGADMLLAPKDVSAVYQALNKAVSAGTISEDRIDESVQRILTAKLDAGLMK